MKLLAIKEKINNLDYIKCKKFYSSKDTRKQIASHRAGKDFSAYTSNKYPKCNVL